MYSALATPPPTPPIPSWLTLESCESDDRQARIPPPALSHTLHQADGSVLSLAADNRRIYSGSQADIHVWCRDSFQLVGLLQGHTGSVLALELYKDKSWLISSSGDSTVRIWNTETMELLYILTPFAGYGSGDIFSIAFSATSQTLFLGCQNTSLQWFDFSEGSRDWNANTEPGSTHLGEHLSLKQSLSRKPHKFFDSQPQPAGRPIPSPHPSSNSFPVTPSSTVRSLPGATTPPLAQHHQLQMSSSDSNPGDVSEEHKPSEPRVLSIPQDNWVPSAHYGYIYCMAIVPEHESDGQTTQKQHVTQLVTGSGDEDVKLWSYSADPSDTANNITLLHTFYAQVGGVLSIISRNGNIYAGCQSGHVKIWDIETKTLVRTIIAQENVDILSLSMTDGELYTCSAGGCIQRFSPTFDKTGCWRGHSGPVLTSIIVPSRHDGKKAADDRRDLITGASDNNIKVWAIRRSSAQQPGCLLPETTLSHNSVPSQETNPAGETDEAEASDTLVNALSQFISFSSVSGSLSHHEDCRQAAIWLKKCLIQFGAESQLLYGIEGKNPVVFGLFRGSESKQARRRVLFYGHYDVIAAGPPSSWQHDPFTLTGLNGYLYGRGVTDNKGPVLAVACAASEMLARRSLDIDLVLLIEGEEEAGSGGFEEAVRKYKDQIGHIDAILVSNSYWIDDARPCITYGLRGVIHATIEVQGEGPDVHSGVDGGAHIEPMMDMTKVLSKLSEGTRIAVPGFYDNVRKPVSEEDESFRLLSEVTGRTPASFSSRWREPTLSVHSIQDSGLSGNPTIIPSRVRAKISVRIVPDQDLKAITEAIESSIQATFDELQSPNSLHITIDRTADWWIGSFDHPWFKSLESAIYDEWGVQPLRIREGGSIPSVPFLEKEFGCPALHLPMGQSSDQAHLRNERISLNNLRKGKSVVERFFHRMSTTTE
ncbi:hypothetical protein M407DRAFT_19497 [Tulasnella calospora MUT 4182]|uniref:Peptidase M20 dimerisation domain-containing protein n=1 Tax=Tulasnella calospora MUT 4182 TaxID=1051891 RepID=A0A0C3QRW5_9AGAM|nr:hypothetical protein M407DRAFT_19497 [Tulasnella calospora MUT 4182]